MGVVSVSPVARQHTSAAINEKATEMIPRGTEILKAISSTMTIPIVMGTSTAMSQVAGTSMRAISSLCVVFWPFLNTKKARDNVRHSSATAARLENTMTDVPPHSAQRTGLKSPSAFILNDGT